MARLYFIFAALEDEQRADRTRWRRSHRESLTVNRMPDIEFERHYRLTRPLFEELCQEIVPLLPPRGNVRGIDPVLKILTALTFYARGSYQGAVGQNIDAPMAQQTVSRCLHEVTSALNAPQVVQRHIYFPQNREQRAVLKRRFFDKYAVPGVIGCIDCTHIAIIRPSEDEEKCFNRKHYHSLNTQVICDCDCIIIAIDASHGGADHDAFIWRDCEIKDHLEQLDGETVHLLGDSGYPLREYLIIPFDRPVEDSPEGRFNRVHKKERATVERTFGILKGRWRCLLAARELHYTPEFAGRITIACSVLHNKCMRAGLNPVELEVEEMQQEQLLQPPIVPPPRDPNHHAAVQGLERGRRARAALVQALEANRARLAQ